jgi:purine nucleosidase/pyrimidine-specific ribonucleoside hydrolase
MPQKIILDTDIGDDIDDALALALACASPEFELLGVTTVFGSVAARARQARTILKIAGERFAKIPVAVGCGGSMASRPNQGNAWYLENHVPNQDSTCLPESELPPLEKRHAVNFLIDTIMGGAGDIIPITIGAMTNLASAIVLQRRILAKLGRIVCMAGEFKQPMAEWNIRCDPEAAHLIFSSGIPVTLITWSIGRTVSFDQWHVDRLKSSDRPLAQRLSAAIAAWQAAHKFDHHAPMPALYDPMALATMIKPDLCTWNNGTIRVDLRGEETYGYTRLEEKPDGKHRVAWAADRDAALEFYLSRVLKL